MKNILLAALFFFCSAFHFSPTKAYTSDWMRGIVIYNRNYRIACDTRADFFFFITVSIRRLRNLDSGGGKRGSNLFATLERDPSARLLNFESPRLSALRRIDVDSSGCLSSFSIPNHSSSLQRTTELGPFSSFQSPFILR